jgi:hypothetical protein
MKAYEFYWRDGQGKDHLIGILPERRKDPNRITKESVLKWGEMVFGDGANNNNIIIRQMSIDHTTGHIFEVNAHFGN